VVIERQGSLARWIRAFVARLCQNGFADFGWNRFSFGCHVG